MLTNRFIKFYHSLNNCNKSVIRNLCNVQLRDARSTFGGNILNLCLNNADFNPCHLSKNIIKYHEIPTDQNWRVSMIQEILQSFNNDIELNFSNDYLNHILKYVSES